VPQLVEQERRGKGLGVIPFVFWVNRRRRSSGEGGGDGIESRRNRKEAGPLFRRRSDFTDKGKDVKSFGSWANLRGGKEREDALRPVPSNRNKKDQAPRVHHSKASPERSKKGRCETEQTEKKKGPHRL